MWDGMSSEAPRETSRDRCQDRMYLPNPPIRSSWPRKASMRLSIKAFLIKRASIPKLKSKIADVGKARCSPWANPIYFLSLERQLQALL